MRKSLNLLLSLTLSLSVFGQSCLSTFAQEPNVMSDEEIIEQEEQFTSEEPFSDEAVEEKSENDVEESKEVIEVQNEMSGKCGANLTWTLDDKGLLTISGTGAMSDFEGVGSPWKNIADSIQKVSIEQGVTSIGKYTFYYCSNLTSIRIPNSVTSVGNYAFEKCISLTNITIPNSVTSIGHDAFYGCRSLTSVDVSSNVTRIEVYTFSGCSSLTSVTIPDSVTSIEKFAFYGCSSLTSVTIPDSVTSIEEFAFYGCNNLKTAGPIGSSCNIEFGWKKSIPEYDLSVFDSLISLTIPNSVTSIRDYAFKNCVSLTGVKIPDGVEKIGQQAFYDCKSLTNITIPNSVMIIGNGAFAFCESLTEIHFIGNIPQISDDSFYRDKIKAYYYDTFDVSENLLKSYGGNIEWIVQHVHTEVVDKAVASTCTMTGLTEGKHCSKCNEILVAQQEVAKLGHNYSEWKVAKEATCTESGSKERKCTRCKDVQRTVIAALGHTEVVDKAVESTCSTNGLTEGKHCSKCNEVLIAQKEVAKLGHSYSEWKVTKESTCTELGSKERTCTRCKDVQTKEIEALGHEEVEDKAMETTCTTAGLTEGKHCSICKEVLVVQEEVAKLGHNYGDWKVIKEATCTETGSKERTCSRCKDVQRLEIESLGYEAAGDNLTWKLSENGVLKISGKGSMYNYNEQGSPWFSIREKINEVVIEEGVTTIGNYAFQNCENLRTIKIPSTVNKIGSFAFDICSKLQYAYFSSLDSFLNIEYENSFSHPFRNACDVESHNLYFNNQLAKNVIIPDGVSTIKEEAFIFCDSIESIKIPSSVTYIGGFAFYGCWYLSKADFENIESFLEITYEDRWSHPFVEENSSLYLGGMSAKEIVIPDSISIISQSVFINCSNLKSIYLPKTITKVEEWAFCGCDNINEILYEGSENDWKKMSISEDSFLDVKKVTYNRKSPYDDVEYVGISLDKDGDYVITDEEVTIYASMYDDKGRPVTDVTYEWYWVNEENDDEWVLISDQTDNLTLNKKDIEDYGNWFVCIAHSEKYGWDVAHFNVLVDFKEVECVYLYISGDDGDYLISDDGGKYVITNDTITLKASMVDDKDRPVTDTTYEWYWIDQDNKDNEDLGWVRFDNDSDCLTLSYYDVAKYGHEYVVIGNSEKYVEDINFINVDVKDKEFLEMCKLLKGYSLSLSGDIAVNYYLDLSEPNFVDSNSYMIFCSGTGKQSIFYTKDTPIKEINGKKYNVFTQKVSAKDMMTKISSQFFYNGKVGPVNNYYVSDYAYSIIENEKDYDSNSVKIAKAMLTYGKYAQEYFEYNTSNVPSNVNSISSVDFKSYAYKLTDNNSSLDFVGARLILTSKPGLKLYFTGKGNFKVNGQSVTTTTEGKYTVITISDIDDMQKMYSITADNFKLEYGIFSYGNQANNTSNTKLKNLIYAMYAYSQALKS